MNRVKRQTKLYHSMMEAEETESLEDFEFDPYLD